MLFIPAMYRPAQFLEADQQVLREIMEKHSFATLVAAADGELVANHFPLLLREKQDGTLAISGHMAKANPQWKTFQDGKEVLVIFQGPHCYISPSWYEPGVHVPTWNYAAVHAYGHPQLLSGDETYRLLETLVRKHEARFPDPWILDLPLSEKDDILRAIVGFEIPIRPSAS